MTHGSTDNITEKPRRRRPRRAYGMGSISYSPRDGRYVGAISLDGVRYWVSDQDRDECEAKLLEVKVKWLRNGRRASIRPYKPRKASLKMSVADASARVLRSARANGWTTAETAAILAAQLTPSRLAWGIIGPCIYCKTWLADSVDHLIPVSRGGRDLKTNLASACMPCNMDKGTRTKAEYLALLEARKAA